MNDLSQPNDDAPEADESIEANADVKYPKSSYLIVGKGLTDEQMVDAVMAQGKAYRAQMEELKPDCKP